MVETIETFVEKLQQQGVQAGQSAAEKIRSEAEQQAKTIISQAEKQAQQIIAQAKSQAESIIAKSRTEVELAIRDAVLKLRSTLQGILQEVLAGPVTEKLNDSEFLRGLLHELVILYAQADSKNACEIKIKLTPEKHKELADWAINEIRKAACDVGNCDAKIDLKSDMKEAGFEYQLSAGTVEVSRDAVVAMLMELVGPELRKMVDKAAKSAINEEK